MLSPSVGHYTFVRGDGQALDFQPGQFLQLHVPLADGGVARRSYSLAMPRTHAPTPDDTIEIAVSHMPGGVATELLTALEPGGTVAGNGPYGRFCLLPDDANRRYLLVATGTGVTPYRAMLPQLERLMAERGVEVVLLFGVRSAEDLLYGDEFRTFADAHPGFRFMPCFSRGLPADPHPDMRHGYVQQFLGELEPDADGDIAYLCGNPGMVDACVETLTAAGLGPARIRREKYTAGK